jgi:hypothetical protein
MRFCPNCGIPVGDSPRYCAGCGTQVSPGQLGSAPAGAEPAERGPFDSAPPRVAPAEPAPVGSVFAATSTLGEQTAGPAPLGVPETWLPEELSAAPGCQASSPSGFEVRDPWAHHELADPWTPAAGPPAGAGPVSGSAPPTWFEALSPGSHPQAGGLAGAAAPARRPRRAAPGARHRTGWSGHRMTITAMAATVALVSTAGIAVWQVSQLHAQPSVASDSMHTQSTGLATGTGHPGSTQPAAHGRAAPLPRASASPPARHRAAPAKPAVPVGNAVVTVGPLAAHVPHVRQVVALLTTYFESINSQNFAEYQSLFVPFIQRTMTHFGSGYAGTFDSGATLTQLVATGPHGLAATVAFISHQNPANSPDGARCDSWLITLFLKQQGNTLRIRHPRPGFPQSVLACG